MLAEAGCFGESFRGRHLGFVWKEGCSSSSSSCSCSCSSSCSSNIHCTWALAFPFNISLSRLHHINFISFSRWDKTRRVGLTLIPSYLLVICCSPTPHCSGFQGTGTSVGPCVGLVVWFPLFRIGKKSCFSPATDTTGSPGPLHIPAHPATPAALTPFRVITDRL